MLASSAGSIARELPGKCPGIARETGGHARDVLPWSPILVDTVITQRPSTTPPVGAELAGRIVRLIDTLIADVVNGVCPNSLASVVPIALPNSSSSSNADEPHVSRFRTAAQRSRATERQFGEDEAIHQRKIGRCHVRTRTAWSACASRRCTGTPRNARGPIRDVAFARHPKTLGRRRRLAY